MRPQTMDQTSSPPTTPTSKHTRGVLKFFSFSKRFGYITPEEGPEIHLSAAVLGAAGFVQCPPGTALEVWYVINRRGPTAVRVAPLGER